LKELPKRIEFNKTEPETLTKLVEFQLTGGIGGKWYLFLSVTRILFKVLTKSPSKSLF